MNARAKTGWIERLAGHPPDLEALSFGGRTAAYGALAAGSLEVADRFGEIGVESGDLVAILAPPSVAGVLLIHAMFEEGIVILPLNSRLSEIELHDAMEQTGARFLFISEESDLSLATRLSALLGSGLVVYSEGSSSPYPRPRLTRLRPPEDGRALDFVERREEWLSKRIALVLQTSGTSGRAKAALLSLDNLLASAEASTKMLGWDPGDRWLLCMPLFHIGGLSILVRSALRGTAVILHSRFDAEGVATAIEEEGVTHVSLVATMLERLLDVRGGRSAPASLMLVLLGGGPASSELLSRACSQGYPIAPTYGLTEAASQVATRPPSFPVEDGADLRAELESLPGVEIRIVDRGGKPVAAGCEGEIEVSGAIVMEGYLADPESTAKAIRGGWLETGDIGRLDERGRLCVLDRRSDLIVSGGENIYPAEIESVLAGHPDVVDCGVVGRPDERFGARPIAFVVLRAGGAFDRFELESFCRERLASYKVPDEFFEMASLPRTVSGKLRRGELRGLARRG